MFNSNQWCPKLITVLIGRSTMKYVFLFQSGGNLHCIMAFQRSPFMGVRRTNIPVLTSRALSPGRPGHESRALSPGRIHNHVRVERTVSPIRKSATSPLQERDHHRHPDVENRSDVKLFCSHKIE